MEHSAKLLLVLALALAVGERAQSQDAAQGQPSATVSRIAPVISSIPGEYGPSARLDEPRVTRYATRFSGDHSVETTTVTEQIIASYTLYAVHLQFVSGAEQLIVVAAPPGGLQPEMRDMSGDNVPNDVVLTSRLLGLPLVVLLNGGHDHLTVAISPGSFSSDEGRASAPGHVHHASALPASSFRAGSLLSDEGTLLLDLRENPVSPTVSPSAKCAEHPSGSGRAPPAPVAQL